MSCSLSDATAHAVQQALAPVFLLTALAGLLKVFADRLAQVSGQVDQLAQVNVDLGNHEVRLRWLRTRSLALDLAVLLGALACCATCSVVLALFASTAGLAAQPRVVSVMFPGAVVLTLASVLAFVVEMLGAARGSRRQAERRLRP